MIDYARLGRAVDWYKSEGFSSIEVPWTVTDAVSNITKPPGKTDWEITGKNKVLVASGEQGFLYLYLKGFLPRGRFQTVTPCFRDEPFDMTHTKYFMKNELISTEDTSEKELDKIITIAAVFFEEELGCPVVRTETPFGFDLECGGHELGSYGIRSTPFISGLTWIYGTGLAEPRMSTIKNMLLHEGHIRHI